MISVHEVLPKHSQAAGVIHTDFEKGFIRAEVMKYDDLKRLGTEQAAKDACFYKVEEKSISCMMGTSCILGLMCRRVSIEILEYQGIC